MTLTEDSAIAAAAMIGDSRMPKAPGRARPRRSARRRRCRERRRRFWRMLRIVASPTAARAHDAGQVALQQRDAGAFDGDIGAGAHGDADIGGGERRRVVDAVAGHGDDAALAAQLLDDLRLAWSGSTSASTSVMPSFARDGAAVVRCRRSA
jgi:hypothetical protein